MPIRKKNKRRMKKKPVAKLYRKPKGFSPGVFSFKRSRTEVITLQDLANTGWTSSTTSNNQGIGRAWNFNLGDLNDKDDFALLFKYFRIKAVRVQIYFSNTGSEAAPNSNEFSNCQLLVHTDINQDGSTTGVANIHNYMDSQTAKKHLALSNRGKPIDILMRLKQSNSLYKSAGSTAYGLQSPQWLNTQQDFATPHYGLKMFIGRIDGAGLTTGYTQSQKMRIIYTYYIQCKKVQ